MNWRDAFYSELPPDGGPPLRCVKEAGFGYVCFERGHWKHGQDRVDYVHKGLACSKEKANAWLKGEDPELFEVYRAQAAR